MATAVADALVTSWICRFGIPDDLTSDRGVPFATEVWGLLMLQLGMRHHFTTPYHPQSNGMIERAHRQIKDSLRARLVGADWASHLPWVLLGLTAAPKEVSVSHGLSWSTGHRWSFRASHRRRPGPLRLLRSHLPLTIP